jgi:HD-GYP domain-containing protein (c-di-GMP phosphodiesterase class II)
MDFAQSPLDFLMCLARAAEVRDNEAGAHNCRVGCYSRAIADGLGMSSEFVELISLASPFHDIGKIGIPDSILLKPGKLTAEERKAMQEHCVIGDRILRPDRCDRPAYDSPISRVSPNPLLDMAADIALMHHEKPNGGGYPRGLPGSAIPIEASIVALADVYDALRSCRPYKPPYSEAQSLDIMRANAGTQFDLDAYAGFEAALHSIRDV